MLCNTISWRCGLQHVKLRVLLFPFVTVLPSSMPMHTWTLQKALAHSLMHFLRLGFRVFNMAEQMNLVVGRFQAYCQEGPAHHHAGASLKRGWIRGGRKGWMSRQVNTKEQRRRLCVFLYLFPTTAFISTVFCCKIIGLLHLRAS